MKKNYILFLLTLLFVWVAQAQVTLTQSVDPVTVDDGGVACWSAPPGGTGEYRENSFMRAYNLADFSVTGDFAVSSVEYGQGAADDGKIITVNIYSATSDDLASATLTLLGTAMHTSAAADDLTLVSVPISVTVPAGSTVAFEVLAGDGGTNTGETFFPGLNSAGENDDSYIVATGCSINIPSTLTSIGQTDQYVMNVIGNDLLSVDEFSLNSISIAPNPTTDFVNLSLPTNIGDFSTELYSVTGQLVMKQSNIKTMDVSELNSGIYILRIKSDLGSVSRRIVKQ